MIERHADPRCTIFECWCGMWTDWAPVLGVAIDVERARREPPRMSRADVREVVEEIDAEIAKVQQRLNSLRLTRMGVRQHLLIPAVLYDRAARRERAEKE